MRRLIIDIPDKLYEKAMEIAKELNITFDELCSLAAKKFYEEYEAEELKFSKKNAPKL